MTAKEQAIRLIHTLPDDVGLGEIIDRLHVVQKVEIGITQADAG